MTKDSSHSAVDRFLKGHVLIRVRHAQLTENKWIVARACGNLVVNGMYTTLANLLVGTLTSNSISQIQLGTNATPADPANTSIAQVTVLSPVTISHGSVYGVTATGVWAAAESDANDIVEVGLLTGSNTLLARYVFAPMRKSAGWEWEIAWTLEYLIS
jgi:hypothetical protein